MNVSFKFKIYRSPDVVWQYLNQPTNITKWMYGFVSYKLLDEAHSEKQLTEYVFDDGASKTKILQHISKSKNKDYLKLHLDSNSQIHHVEITLSQSGKNATKMEVNYSTEYKNYFRNLAKYLRYKALQKRHNDNLLRLKQSIEFDAA